MKFLFNFLFLAILILKTRSQTENQTENQFTELTGLSENFTQKYSTNEEENEVNFCPELYPFCFCRISSIIIQCKNFSAFSQLNFSLLLNETDNLPRRVYELELEPLSGIPLDTTLSLDGISLYGRVILKKITGFDLMANPFQNVIENNNLYLNLYNVNLETIDNDKICRSNLTLNHIPLFASFNYVLLSENTFTKSGHLCPLMFKNANLRGMDIYDFNSNSTIKLSNIENNYNLNTTIKTLTIYAAKNLTITSNFLNSQIFEKLQDLTFDYVQLSAIEENTFQNLVSLRRVILDLSNMADFIQGSDNKWMDSLNFDVGPVNYSNPNQMSMLANRTLVITFNSRNGKQYSFPNDDLDRFKYFPHQRLVYARILADLDLECSETLRFLSKNAYSYPSVSFLNTTSAYKCFLSLTEHTTNKIESFTSEVITQEISSSKVTMNKPTTTVISSSKEKSVSLNAYLGTTIPLGAFCLMSILIAIYFYKKRKIVPLVDDKNIALF